MCGDGKEAFRLLEIQEKATHFLEWDAQSRMYRITEIGKRKLSENALKNREASLRANPQLVPLYGGEQV